MESSIEKQYTRNISRFLQIELGFRPDDLCVLSSMFIHYLITRVKKEFLITDFELLLNNNENLFDKSMAECINDYYLSNYNLTLDEVTRHLMKVRLNKLVTEFTFNYDVEIIKNAIILYDDFADDDDFCEISKLSKYIYGEIDDFADFNSFSNSFLLRLEGNMINSYIKSDKQVYVHKLKACVLNKNISILNQNDLYSDSKFHAVFARSFKVLGEQKFKVQYSSNNIYENYGINLHNSSDWIYACLINDRLCENGKGIMLMPDGMLYNRADKDIRRYFVNNGLIESIISLPNGIIRRTNIHLNMVVISKTFNKSIRYVDANNLGCRVRLGTELNEDDISKIIDAYNGIGNLYKDISIEKIDNDSCILALKNVCKNEIEVKDGQIFSNLIIDIKRGSRLTSKNVSQLESSENTPYKYISIGNIQEGYIDNNTTNLKEVNKSLMKYSIKDGSLIITKTGAHIKLAIADCDDNILIPSANLYVIELDKNIVNPYYLLSYLMSTEGNAQLEGCMVSVTIPTLSLEDLKKIKVPIIPMNEQNEIADEFIDYINQIILYKSKISNLVKNLEYFYDDKRGE